MRFVSQLKDRTKDLIIIILALILCTVIFFLRYRYNCALLVSHPRLLLPSASFTYFGVSSCTPPLRGLWTHSFM